MSDIPYIQGDYKELRAMYYGVKDYGETLTENDKQALRQACLETLKVLLKGASNTIQTKIEEGEQTR